MQKQKINDKGFTLLEMLVVVLIIGILAGIALPQYQMAVTKAKVASILPLMRRWKDALTEYKLQHGDYDVEDSATLGIYWPSDWFWNANDSCENQMYCRNNYWGECYINGRHAGDVYCAHYTNDGEFDINMYQSDDPDFENFRSKITCYADGDEGHKICKALGGKITEDGEDYILY